MTDSSRGSSEGRGHTRLREVLVVAEVALACVLLVGGGLLLKSFSRVLDVELGFEPGGVAAWRVDTDQPFETQAARVAFYDQLVGKVASLPGVEAVGLTDCLPLGRNRTWGIAVKGVAYEDDRRPSAFPRIVDHRYLSAMGIPLLAGRPFHPDDTEQTGRVIIINETGARELFPEQDPLGGVLMFGPEEFQVVGVVADVRHRSLEQESGIEMYMLMSQVEWGTLDMVVRSPLPVESLVGPVRSAIQANDPTMPTGDFKTLEAVVEGAVSPRRFTLLLLAAFAGAALLLAALGIYGVLSYTVSRRIPEIGIRMALGESAGRVMRRVVGRTLALAGVGVALGAGGSILVSRLMGSLLFGVEPTDPLTFLSMATVLLTVSAMAGYLPARRASRTDPIAAIRAG